MKKVKNIFALIGIITVVVIAYGVGKNARSVTVEEVPAKEAQSKLSDETVSILNEGIENIKEQADIEKAKDMLGTAISDGIREMGNEALANTNTEMSEETKEELKQNITETLTEATESLPYFTEEDVDDVVEKAIAKIESACSEEYIDDYLHAQSLKEFNQILTEKFTAEERGFVGKFMTKWIQHMPNINDVLDVNGSQ